MTEQLENRGSESPEEHGSEGSALQAPAYDKLPTAKYRTARSGPMVAEIAVRIEVVTPILGGSSQIRRVDEMEIIRATAVRGYLRFWWRALYSHQYQTPEELYTLESELWGLAAAGEVRRSAVDVRIDVEQAGVIDDSDIDLQQTPGAYALWPARAEKKQGQITKPPAPRRKPGTRFRLTLIAPADRQAEVCSVVRAWLLFGGYGSRTRRGLGSLKVIDDSKAWLPAGATREGLTTLFARDVFAPPSGSVNDVPWLAGASLQIGKADKDALRAWTTALDWLKEFRQGSKGQHGVRAREPGTGKPQPQRPSISNWPEADKVRHLCGKTKAHPPRHNSVPAWPRAAFGLPIIGQFQTKARDGSRLDEPGEYKLYWCSGGKEQDRLASPLIVKALPLADGSFVSCALWLNRALPQGEVVLWGVERSAAPFDRLIAQGDTPYFSALRGRHSLREAFLDWLQGTYKTTVVAP